MSEEEDSGGPAMAPVPAVSDVAPSTTENSNGLPDNLDIDAEPTQANDAPKTTLETIEQDPSAETKKTEGSKAKIAEDDYKTPAERLHEEEESRREEVGRQRDWRDRREDDKNRRWNRNRNQGNYIPKENFSKNIKSDVTTAPESSDPAEIRKQVEFYFSDSNLPYDKFLLSQVGGTENKPVPITTLHKFKRMRHFQPYEAVVAALKESDELEVTENEEVKRKVPLPEGVTTEPQGNVDIFEDKTIPRSIYAKGFGTEHSRTQFDIEAFFAPYGPTRAIRLRRYDPEKIFKGSVFVEFDTEEGAKAFLALEPKPKWEGKDLTFMSKEAYVKGKAADIAAGRIKPSSPRGKGSSRGDFRGRGRGDRGRDRGRRGFGDRRGSDGGNRDRRGNRDHRDRREDRKDDRDENAMKVGSGKADNIEETAPPAEAAASNDFNITDVDAALALGYSPNKRAHAFTPNKAPSAETPATENPRAAQNPALAKMFDLPSLDPAPRPDPPRIRFNLTSPRTPGSGPTAAPAPDASAEKPATEEPPVETSPPKKRTRAVTAAEAAAAADDDEGDEEGERSAKKAKSG